MVESVKVNRDFILNVGVLCTTLGGILAGWHWLDGRFDEVQSNFRALEKKVEQLEQAHGDRWSAYMMKLWVMDLEKQNPALHIPDPWRVMPAGFPK